MRWLIIFLCFIHFLHAEKEAEIIAKMSANHLFELNQNEIGNSLLPYLQAKENIQQLWIIDKADGSLFFSYGLDIATQTPKSCARDLERLTTPILYESDVIGTLTLCLTKEQDALDLSKNETDWIRKHPVITVHNETNWAPFNFNKDGQPMGYSIDTILLLAKKLGLKVEFVTGEWSELLKMANAGKLDVMMNIARTKEREKYLRYVGIYARAVTSILAKNKRTDITDIDSLNGKTVSVVKGFFYEKFLESQYPKIKQLQTNSSLEAIKAVYYGKADATLGKTPILNHLLREHLITGMKFTADVQADDPETENLYLAVRRNAPELQSALKKALNAITPQEKSALITKWLGSDAGSKVLDNLTDQERAWLEEHSPIRLGSTDNWPPFDMVDEKGRHKGINADFIKRLTEIIGSKIEPVINPLWDGVIQDAKEGKSYAITALPEAPEYKKDFLFTQTYANNPVVIITKADATFNHIRDLKKIITVKGNDFSQELSPKQFSNIQYRDTTLECFNAVLEGKSEGYIGWLADAQYLLTQNAIVGLRPTLSVPSQQSALKIGVSKEHPELKTILDKALDLITPDERNKIISAWTGGENMISRIKLNSEEQAWLQEHSTLTYSESPWEPLVFVKEGQISGMIYDYLELFSAKTGMQFEYRQENHWPKVLEQYESGELSFIPSIVSQHFSGKSNHISAPYLSFPLVIAAHEEVGFINSLEQLIGKRVAVGNGFSSMRLIQERYPTLQLVPVTDTEEGIRALSNGKADVYVGLAPVVSHWLRASGVKGLKIAGVSKEELSFSFTSKDPIFIKIMNKAIQSLTPEEVGRIEQKYIDIDIEAHIDYDLLWKLGIGVMLVILGFTWWNRTMAKEIKQRKAAQHQLNEAMEELQATHEKISDSINYASLIQSALLPIDTAPASFFRDHFSIWQPKDVVGGDIYFFESLRNDKEALLMVIDCTGHGVPGAFMTMLVKAVEQSITAELLQSEKEIHPAEILQLFNRTIRSLLKQDSDDTASNAGFDGGVLYFDYSRKLVRFAGAETPLFYSTPKNTWKVIKGDRHGIGYRTSKPNYVFTEHELSMDETGWIIISTDGYLDQNGGEKSFPFGKKRFKKILEEYGDEPAIELKEILLIKLGEWQDDEERNDDVTVIGIQV